MKKKVNTRRAGKTSLLKKVKEVTHLTGGEDHSITLQDASEMTRAYRELNPGQPIAEFFGKKTIIDILNQPSCVGIRIYYGIDPASGEKHLVIVGVRPNKNDLYQGVIAERGVVCPTCCGITNPLNS